MSLKTFFVDFDDAGMRVDAYLAYVLDDLSRAYIQKLIREGLVCCNERQIKANYRISPGDEIAVDLPEPQPLCVPPIEMDLDILYEDDDLIFINKPKGLVVHPAPGHMEDTLVNGLLWHCRNSLSGINGILRPGIVHRIDKDTSGVIVVCKNDSAHRSVALQLAEHSAVRRYQAICCGAVTEDGTVDAPIARSRTNRQKMAIDRSAGKRAVTHYHVLETFDKYTYIECALETGRTHQIRVHMDSISHPLMGDTVYGNRPCPFRTDGQVLHAGVLGLVHPSTGQYIEFTAPLPEYFSGILSALRLRSRE
ncbi:MAG: RluA family pseudouridine synthase [Lachnospiraceae bacterium]|nr:RluA family pseudouridine synthase [Lachnospiraceae bacterium]